MAFGKLILNNFVVAQEGVKARQLLLSLINFIFKLFSSNDNVPSELLEVELIERSLPSETRTSSPWSVEITNV